MWFIIDVIIGIITDVIAQLIINVTNKLITNAILGLFICYYSYV